MDMGTNSGNLRSSESALRIPDPNPSLDLGKLRSYSEQHYPAETQKNNNSFASRNLMMGKDKKLEFPEEVPPNSESTN
jgi:hypothetical protein